MTDTAADSAATVDPLDPEWLGGHFDHLAPELAPVLHDALAYLREHHPVAHSDKYEQADGGFFFASRYEDVLAIAQDWQTWSSAKGMTVPYMATDTPIIPEQADPPLHREYKKLINVWFRPAVVLEYEETSKRIVNDLIDGFIESGSCDFMEAFGRSLPGQVFFEEVLHAPTEMVGPLTQAANTVSKQGHPDQMAALGTIMGWINEYVAQRRTEPPQDDVVNAIINAQIEGRPITEQEVMGIIALLLFGGLDTTAGALGQMMIRFCEHPEIPALLREKPELIEDAVEELLRLDASFVTIGRTATKDTEISGCPVSAGQRVMISWASANRDETEFPDPNEFSLERGSNRHITFGAGPHRCAGSNLARMNLRVAVAALVNRLHDLRLDMAKQEIPYHSGLNRSPEVVKIAFTPGRRLNG